MKKMSMSRNDGSAVLMTKDDHALTRIYAGMGEQTMITDVGLNARQRI